MRVLSIRPVATFLLAAAALLWGQSLPDLVVQNLDTSSMKTDSQTLAVSGVLAVTIGNSGGSPVAGSFKVLVFEDRNWNRQFDAAIDKVLGSALYSTGLAIGAQTSISIPLGGIVSFGPSPLYAFADSDGTILELSETNNLRSTALNSRQTIAPGKLKPYVKWNKKSFSVLPEYADVMQAPVVADLNGDGTPDIVFSTFTERNYLEGYLRAISGKDGTELWTVSNPQLKVLSHDAPAIGDIDGDGKPEILVLHQDRTLMAFEHDGTFKWKGVDVIASRNLSPSYNVGGVSLADLNGDGSVEIIFGSMVFNAQGQLLWKGTKGQGDSTWGGISIAADIDLDGSMEIVAGNTAYRANGQIYWTRDLPDGYGAIGNFDSDPFPEIVLVSCEQGTLFCKLYLLEHDGSTKWGPIAIPGPWGGGPPTVGDFDGDGRPDIAVASVNWLTVFTADGSVKWQQPSYDPSSGGVASSAFDFDGDGNAELIYGDEINLRIFNGTDGIVLGNFNKSSGTLNELPVVVDVDGDGHAEIVAVADRTTGLENGIFVYGGADGNWANTRKIWNQHAYSVTNVNDDATIPKKPLPNWLQPGLNNFRQNAFAEPGKANTAPDLTSSFIRKNDAGFPTAIQLTARLGNLGGAITGSAFGSNLVQNGSFETATPVCPVNNFDIRLATDASATSISGWRVVRSNIAYTHTGYFQAGDGNCAVELDGKSGTPGAIEQIIATTPGKTYKVGFVMSGNFSGFANIRYLRVSAAGQSVDYSFNVTKIRDRSDMRYERLVWSFAANSTSTTLRFEGTDPTGGAGPLIDDVELREVLGAAQPVSAAFYRGDPDSGGTLIGTAQTSTALAPGEFEDVSVAWNNAPAGLHPIVVVADPGNLFIEGDETNNKAGANVLLGVGPFPVVDSLISRFKDRSADVVWTAVPGATGYNIYRRTGTSGPVLVKRNHIGTSYTDTALINRTPYFYFVRWVNAQGVESGTGTEASATPSPIPSGGDTAPSILSYPVVRARAGTPYSYQLRAGDPDIGDALSYSLVSPPPAMAVNATGLVTWIPGIAAAGYNDVSIRVQDTRGRFATQTYRLFVEVQVVDGPPVISSTPITRSISGELYAYQVLAKDPENGLLTYGLTVAPPGMTINQNTGLIQWIPTRAEVGSQNAVVRVSDAGGNTATQSFTVQVSRGNKPPVITSFAISGARVDAPYVYAVTATDPDADPITFSILGAPSGMTINSSTGLVQWTPSAAQQGTVNIEIRAADNGGLIAAQKVAIVVRSQNLPPVISSSPILTAAVNQLYSYQVTVTDPNLPDEGFSYALTTAPNGMSINAATGLIAWTPTAAHSNTNQGLTVQATDAGGLTATQSFTVRVSTANTQLPVVSLLTPANGVTIAADAPMTGSATDANLRLWRVEYRPVGTPNWLPLTSGNTQVTNGSLGIFPATLLANDVYRLRLYAENTVGSVTTPEIEVQVNTQQLKMGDFTLRFEDMRVPGFTFPISIIRGYDTKRPQAGDFGPGWTLGFSEADVRVDVNFNVFVTLPDARRVKFAFTPDCASPLLGACLFNIVNIRFTPEGGVYDKLEALDCPTGVFTPVASCDVLGGQRTPNQWKLTTKEGLKYFITGNKVTRLEDRAGNWIQIDVNGVTSNTGRNVPFVRNAQGLVTKILEPSPGGELCYEYDGQGRLLRFLKQDGKATTYFYEDARFPHYLTKIIDPLGREALRNVFNAEGRLVAQCDAAGNIFTLAGCSQFNPQPGTKTFTAINGRGFRTDLITDERGNVLTERRYLDAVNFLDTIRNYDGNNNAVTERDPEGNVKTFTYDARGNRLTEADPGGRTTRYTYDAACEKVATITDPARNVTTNTYDAQCNLRFVRDALNKTTEYRYNTASQRTHMIDPNGTSWTWAYLPNGLLQSLTDPFGKATTFSFDNKGNLLSRTDRNLRRIDFQYDAANRLRQERWDTGRLADFVYDDTGALLSAIDPDSSLTIAYDNVGRLLSVDNLGTPGAPRVLVSYSYDQNGNTTRVQDSLGGSTDYAYDAVDRLTRVTQSGTGVQPKRVDMSYSPASILTQLRRFGDLAGTLAVANTNYEYDCGGCAGRLSAIRHRKAADNSVIHDLTFTRDALGNITASTDADGTHLYLYDAVRRLTSATHSNPAFQPNESYSYDAVGNRLTSHLSHLYSYSWQTQGKGNRLLQDNVFDYRYDDEGNQIRRTDRASGAYSELFYDFKNRLTALIERSAMGAQIKRSDYRYDIFNRRLSEVEAGQVVYWVYDQLNPALKLTSTASVVSRRLYTRDLDGIIVDEAAGITRWFLADQVGSVRDLVANTGAMINHCSYDSFGRVLRQSDPLVANDLLFAGREFSISGMGYFRARSMDPRTGRFQQEDRLMPLTYEYAGNNPMRFNDPLGLEFVEYGILTKRNIVYATGGALSLAAGKIENQILRITTRVAIAFLVPVAGAIALGYQVPATVGALGILNALVEIATNTPILPHLQAHWREYLDYTTQLLRH